VRRRTNNDFHATAARIGEQPPSPLRDRATHTFAETVAPHEPVTAANWALTLPASEARPNLLRNMPRQWQNKDHRLRPRPSPPSRDSRAPLPASNSGRSTPLLPLGQPSRRLRVLNLPNSLTVSRLVLTAIFVIGFTIAGPVGYGIALVTFILAAITDFLDGYFARKLNLVTSLGKLLDPIADKVLTASAFIFLSAQDQGFCPTWVVVVILAREFLVTGLRQIAVERGRVIAADWSGKWKTGFQIGFCITALIWLFLQALDQEEFFLATLAHPTFWIMPTFLWLSLALTVISGIQYAWNGRDLLRD
jgi:CDP-diacylglycerol--glycerol-3-phosphate 3-phosphatidyltransferase